MNKLILATVLLAISTNVVKANEIVENYISPVCKLYGEKKVVLSKGAANICNNKSDKLPKMTKKGDRLTKGRNGAEFNTIINNLSTFKK